MDRRVVKVLGAMAVLTVLPQPVAAQQGLDALVAELQRVVDGGRNDLTLRLAGDTLVIGNRWLADLFILVPLGEVELEVEGDSVAIALKCRGAPCVIGRVGGADVERKERHQFFAGRRTAELCDTPQGMVQCVKDWPHAPQMAATETALWRLLEAVDARRETAAAAAAAAALAAIPSSRWVVVHSAPPNEAAVARGGMDAAYRLAWFRNRGAEREVQGMRADGEVHLLRVDCAGNAVQIVRALLLLQDRVLQQLPYRGNDWRPVAGPMVAIAAAVCSGT